MKPPCAACRALRSLVAAIDRFSEWTGNAVAWLVLGMALLVTWDVAMRYLFHSGSVALQELEWHLFALVFLLGAGYTLKHDGHVRIDLLHRSRWMDERRRAWIGLVGGIAMLAPFCLLVIVYAWPFVHDAWVHGEGSPDPGGLPGRWLIKAAIPAGFALLLLQGVAETARHALTLLDGGGED